MITEVLWISKCLKTPRIVNQGLWKFQFSKIDLSILKSHLRLWFTIRNSRIFYPSPRVASTPNRIKTNGNWLNHLHKLNYTSCLRSAEKLSTCDINQENFGLTEVAIYRCLSEQMLLTISQHSQQKLRGGVSFQQSLKRCYKRLQHRCFLVNIAKFFFVEHLRSLLLDTPNPFP